MKSRCHQRVGQGAMASGVRYCRAFLLSFTTKTGNFDALVNAGYGWLPDWTAFTLALVFLVGAAGRAEMRKYRAHWSSENCNLQENWCC
ncbi:hypothetical protein JNB71_09875 [Rhizobium herbae]|uniref:Uncharacterized protein n=1 Tax=Rhizobium herbae TaxID=508661 RepID=A0ABS7H8U3_9HYPH|nr:hypothetical protein [Rhizobium herbae]MBW9063627.1 hypothetical protein [Rhizobium herbae]